MIGAWHWLVAAVLLAAVEVVAPGAAFLWLGSAAALVGVVMLALPDLGWEWQLLLFAVLSIATIIGGRTLYRRLGLHAPPLRRLNPSLNRRAEQYIGTVHTLETAIVNNRGRALVGDSSWTVEGPDLPAGASVCVVAVDGVILKVRQA